MIESPGDRRGRVGAAMAARLRERGLDLSAGEPSSSCSASPTGRSLTSPRAWSRGRGSPTSAARRRWPRSSRTSAASASIPCRRSRATARRAARRRLCRRDRGDARRPSGRLAGAHAGLEPFRLADDRRAAYHAGAAIASNYPRRRRRAAGSPWRLPARRRRSTPLMRRTIENGFELTGPIARGDWETVDAHVARSAPSGWSSSRCMSRSPRRPRPSCEDAAADRGDQERAGCALGLDRARPDDGALHAGHEALIGAARAENDVVVVSLFVNPAQFDEGGDLAAYLAEERSRRWRGEHRGADLLFAPGPDEIYPPGYQTWVDVEELSRGLEGPHRPGHFRGVATVCLKLFNIVRPDRAYFGQKEAAGGSDPAARA